jgi:hypothetical protein
MNSVDHGRRVETHSDGGMYDGEFENELKEGIGYFVWADDSEYKDELHNDTIYGKDVYTWTDRKNNLKMEKEPLLGLMEQSIQELMYKIKGKDSVIF